MSATSGRRPRNLVKFPAPHKNATQGRDTLEKMLNKEIKNYSENSKNI